MRNLVLASVSVLFLSTPSAFASGDWILSGNTQGAVDIQTGAATNTTTYSAGIKVGHGLGSMMEFLVGFNYGKTALTSTWSLEGDLLFVFGPHNNGFVLGGFYGRDNSDVDTYGGIVGKRFAIGSQIAYDPDVRVKMSSTAGAGTHIVVTPLQFTLFL